jgi:hypothetical protein
MAAVSPRRLTFAHITATSFNGTSAASILWPTACCGSPHRPGCSRNDAGWACKVVPHERSALETEIARLQGENATLKKELLARGLRIPQGPSGTKPGEPDSSCRAMLRSIK